ncbi:MAG: RNA methyltransferase [Leptolyngbya sp. SIO4C1]|nr:RNA methyltransferase [Leptolyngbya sp. SIO4C1]
MAAAGLKNLRIVLVEPAGGLNVGAIARVMKNFGLTQLVLVKPHCEPLGAEARQMAVHARDVLEQAQQVPTLSAALVGCQRAVATTARSRDFEAPLESPDTTLPWLLAPSTAAALIFGPEDRGLSNQELTQAQRFLKIPSDPGYPVLNLAQAVAVCCYELSRLVSLPAETGQQPMQSEPNALRTSGSSDKQSASLDVLEGYYHHLESVLLQIGYLYPHTATSRMRKFRRLLQRAEPSADEVALLRGILRQVEWAVSHHKSGSPND